MKPWLDAGVRPELCLLAVRPGGTVSHMAQSALPEDRMGRDRSAGYKANPLLLSDDAVLSLSADELGPTFGAGRREPEDGN